jgi:hypothetical protein
MSIFKKPAWLVLCLMLWRGAEPGACAPTWYWSNPMPHGNDIAGLAYFNGLTIAVTDSGQIYTSDDLALWLPRQTGVTNDLQAITVFGNQVVVTGAAGAVLYSSDGVNYTGTNLATTDWLVGAAASSNLVVAVGDNAAIYTSTDAAHWKRQSAPPNVDGDWLQGVAWGNGTFVTVGDDGYVATSPDGTNWTESAGIASGDLTYVAWINTPGSTNAFATPAFVAVSDQGEAILSTNAGATWSFEPDYTTTTNVLYAAVGNPDSRLIAGDDQLSLERVILGHTVWPTNDPSTPIWTYFCNLWETNLTNQYLVSGEAGFTAAGTETNSVYSWAQLDDSNRSWLWQLATNAGLYVAVGDNATIMTSDDGVTWDTEAFPLTNGVSISNTVFFGVGGNTNLLIAVGNGGATMLSTNQLVSVVTTNADGSLSTNTVSTIGVVWNPVPPATTNDLQSVACFSNQFYVCGGNGTILRSANGMNWTAQTTPTTAYLSGLAVFPGGLVAVGDQGTILSSPDGATWTARTSGMTNWIFRAHYLGGMLIAAGENGSILTSANGTTWAIQSSGTTNWLNEITMVTNNYFIVGNLGTVLGSTNGTAWTNVAIITGESLFGAATQNGQLVVAGDVGAILQAQIVPQTTQLQFLDFAYTTNEAVFLVAPTNNAVDLQFTLDASTNLRNWNTGPLLDLTSGALFFYLPLTNAPPNQFYRATLTGY